MKSFLGRMRGHLPEFTRFVVVGAVNSLLTFGAYMLLLSLMSYRAAYTVSYAAGIGIAYFLNARFVFKEKLRFSKALQFPAVYIVQYVLGLTLLYLLVEKAHANKYVAPLVVLLISVPITYLLSRFILKRPARKRTPSA